MVDKTRVVVDFSDQTALFDPRSFSETVTIIGCGGIGASLIPTLVTMGVKHIELFDPDFVESRNIASQVLYRPADLYRPKVEVCREYILDYCPDAGVTAHRRFFTEADVLDSAVVIGAVDSMAARTTIWRAIEGNSDIQLYLDGRIGGEHMTLFAVDPLDGDWYPKRWLFSDEQAAQLECTRRAIVYPAVVLGAIMCRHLAYWHRGEALPQVTDFSLSSLFLQRIVST
jgi:hypothetical protein